MQIILPGNIIKKPCSNACINVDNNNAGLNIHVALTPEEFIRVRQGIEQENILLNTSSTKLSANQELLAKITF